jgi:hypothetical protein
MTTWLDIIKMELENLDLEGLLEPTTEVGAKDHVVGEADTDLKRLYGLAMQWDKTAIESLVAARYVNNREHQEHHVEKATELHKKSELLMEIFWASIKDSFDLWQKPSVGIRKGWKVVWSEPEVPPIIGILGELFGR